MPYRSIRVSLGLALLWVTAQSVASADAIAVDRPFPTSQSVKDTCTRLPCEELTYVLSQFAREPRDDGWAVTVEKMLREHVAESPGFSIRALECRSYLCAAEVVSTLGQFKIFKYGSSLDKTLLEGIGDVGFETNEQGDPVTVTLRTYIRRSQDVYSGRYFYNFENANFTPDGSKDCWAVEGKMTDAELPAREGSAPWGTAHVVVRGVLGPAGHVGNLGACTHVLRVAELLDVFDKKAP